MHRRLDHLGVGGVIMAFRQGGGGLRWNNECAASSACSIIMMVANNPKLVVLAESI